MESLVGSNSCSEFQILSLMTKQFLRRALEDDASEYSGIVPAPMSLRRFFTGSRYRVFNQLEKVEEK